jgi:hypothetical protein
MWSFVPPTRIALSPNTCAKFPSLHRNKKREVWGARKRAGPKKKRRRGLNSIIYETREAGN